MIENEADGGIPLYTGKSGKSSTVITDTHEFSVNYIITF